MLGGNQIKISGSNDNEKRIFSMKMRKLIHNAMTQDQAGLCYQGLLSVKIYSVT